MKWGFTAIIERPSEGGSWAISPEVPVDSGQRETIEEAKDNLREAVTLISQDRLDFKPSSVTMRQRAPYQEKSSRA